MKTSISVAEEARRTAPRRVVAEVVAAIFLTACGDSDGRPAGAGDAADAQVSGGGDAARAQVSGASDAVGAQGSGAGDAADVVLVNGNVITLDAESRIAEAVAVQGDRILAVGPSAEVERLAGSGTRRVDLAGRSVTPGLIDAHVHFASGGANRLYHLDLSYPRAQSIADVRGMVAEQTGRLTEGEWVRGGGWDEGKLEELRYIRADDLDGISAGHPVWLAHTMGHYGVANSLALDMAGIDATTPDPAGGTIDRDENGRPTGVLKESAMGLVTRLIPPLGPDQRQEAFAPSPTPSTPSA